MRKNPKDTLAVLLPHLEPATRIPTDGFKQLLADLDADKFEPRSKAIEAFVRHGSAADTALRQARKISKLETAQRIDQLLVAIEAEWPRSQWCVRLLEDLRTSEARELLQGLSKGDPEARLTRIARSAFERISKSKNDE
jgi:hypothetical protein